MKLSVVKYRGSMCGSTGIPGSSLFSAANFEPMAIKVVSERGEQGPRPSCRHMDDDVQERIGHLDVG